MTSVYVEQFNKDEAAFYELLGRTTDQWIWVEEALYDIFKFALSCPIDDRAAAVFYSQVNFRAKMDMTDAAIRTFLEEPLLTEWPKIFKRLKNKSRKRAKLVHRRVTLVAEGKPGEIASLKPKLKPDANKPSERLAYFMGTEDIDAKTLEGIMHEILYMRAELEEFLAKLKQLAPPQASPAPTPHPNQNNNPNSQTGAGQS